MANSSMKLPNPSTRQGLTIQERAMVIKVFTTDEGCSARTNAQDCLTDARAWFALGVLAMAKDKRLIEIVSKDDPVDLLNWANKIIEALHQEALEYDY